MITQQSEEELISNLVILYVEDDEEILENFTKILSRKVKHIHKAKHGEEGLEKFKKYKDSIDLIITDIRMPYMNGLEMTTAIKNIKPHTKVIYLSAYSDEDMLMAAINTEADGFITKPINQKIMKILGKLAKEIYKDNILEYYNKTLRQTLDTVDNIIIITDGKTIKDVNKKFFEFVQETNLETFKAHHGCISSKFIQGPGLLKQSYPDKKTWIEEASEQKHAKVKLKNIDGEQKLMLVKPSAINIEKGSVIYVVSFTDITDIN
jgi:YesN/AraC family two-component response regulator